MNKNSILIIVVLFAFIILVILLICIGFSPGEAKETNIEIYDNPGTIIINGEGIQTIIDAEEGVAINQSESQSKKNSDSNKSIISPETGDYVTSSNIVDIAVPFITLILQTLIAVLKSITSSGD